MTIERVTLSDGLVRALSFQKAEWKRDGEEMNNLQARETLLAKGALEGLFAFMYAYVLCEMPLPSKALVAYEQQIRDDCDREGPIITLATYAGSPYLRNQRF